MQINYVCELFSLFYIIMITIVYLSKKRVKTFDNFFFQLLLLINVSGLILEIIATYFCFKYDGNIGATQLFLTEMFNRFYMGQILSYLGIMYLFIGYLCFSKEAFITQTKIFFVMAFVNFLVLCVLDISVVNNTIFGLEGAYVTGPATIFIGIVAVLTTLIALICVISSKIKNKNLVSVAWCILFVVTLSVIVVRAFVPGLTFLFSIVTLGNIILYFIVQSPDAKKVSDLKELRREKQKLDNLKQKFLSNMSREIRVSLDTVVVLSNDIITSDASEEIKDDMKDVIGASDSLLEVISNILDINKIEKEDYQLNEEYYDFKKEIAFCAKISAVKIENKPITFISNIDNTIPDVLYGDKAKIKQIVNNLLSNAFKYTETGKVIFDVISTIKDDVCTLSFSVQDTGKGIDDIPRLFTKFDRLDVDKNSRVEGTGLGLVITDNLISVLGGKLNVTSTVGQGSNFSFTITQRIADSSKLSDEGITYNFNILGKKLLIVDDNELNLAASERFFSKYNVGTDVCSSGSKAIEMIKSKNFDLVLLDTIMPEMDGITTLEKIKTIRSDIPVIALTADVMEDSKDKYLKAGFDGFISKPINKKEVDKELHKIFKE